MRRNRALPIRLLVILGLLLSSSSAQAIPIFRASTDSTGVIGPSSSNESDTAAFDSTSVVFNFTDGKSSNAVATANPSGLGAFAVAAIPFQTEPLVSVISIAGGATARIRLADIILTNEANPMDASFIDVSSSFLLDGGISLLPSIAGDTRSSASVSVTYGFGAPGAGSTAVPQSIGSVSWLYDNGVFSVSRNGALMSAVPNDETVIDDVFETPVYSVPLGEPLTFYLELITSAAVVSRDGSQVSASSDFLNTLTLPTNGPVFNLPAGYTAASVTGNIVNNQLVAPVPVPAAVWLLGSAFGLLVARYRAQSLT